MIQEKAIKHAQYVNSQVSYLGEGAWHQAWQLTSPQHKSMVLRIPKKIAYKKEVAYDANALLAEYGGTEQYYSWVNKVVPGAAPEKFVYHVSEGLTYTIESFAGSHVDLHDLNREDAQKLGSEIGHLYRKMEQVNHGLEGFGFFDWNEESGLHGRFLGDFHEFVTAESKEIIDDYMDLLTKRPIFNKPEIKEAILRICENRLIEIGSPVLTNQDASPENWLVDNGQIRLIDPLPILYIGEVMAANFMNLYETLFVELAHTERYGKHRFHECRETLQSIANGFELGYCGQNADLIRKLRSEQMIQVLNCAVSHNQMFIEGLNEEQIIRYGTKEDVENRLTVFVEKLIELQDQV
ncbi:hypothetical protein HMPREF1210_03191 [Paenisporosarcina sp. HGH0030]|uniref:hypothetical protein n=1 Tax=Paenisporosarcina sp. HGH0030 TaxID=1078085 RepID=UPI00034EBC62|nr:hypothetical protein [Paenisporosarcina sp. HGH0030]EPD49744.1 hypothetical protein HMPREF1210_03191 [Paenisporosarcina sp. HGH0030]